MIFGGLFSTGFRPEGDRLDAVFQQEVVKDAFG